MHPWLGTGSGTFRGNIGAIESGHGRALHGLSAHNAYLSVLVETGGVGLALFAAILGCAAVYASKMKGYDRLLWLTLLGGWGLSAVALTWEADKITWLLLGLLASCYGTYRESPRSGRTWFTPMRRGLAPG